MTPIVQGMPPIYSWEIEDPLAEHIRQWDAVEREKEE
jgi:hypothetical protein